MVLNQITKEMRHLSDPGKAKILAGFFKTGKGEYGEGDKFLGITVPKQRAVAKKYWREITLNELQKLILSEYHEYRLLGFIMLTLKYPRADKNEQKKIYSFYLKNAKRANNWDLVDLSAPNIVGAQLLNGDKKILYQLARSKNLWERRISILATFAFIRAGRFKDSLKIAGMLISDKHDLIHKAAGWMLREIGKKDTGVLKTFLAAHYTKMPRTMLRYAIEKFPESARKHYLIKTTR